MNFAQLNKRYLPCQQLRLGWLRRGREKTYTHPSQCSNPEANNTPIVEPNGERGDADHAYAGDEHLRFKRVRPFRDRVAYGLGSENGVDYEAYKVNKKPEVSCGTRHEWLL